MKTVQTISLLGGHLALDFVNTVDSRIGELGPDYLGTFADLLIWAKRTDVVDAVALGRLKRMSTATPDIADAALNPAWWTL